MNMATASTVLSPDQQEQVAVALEEDAQIMSDTQLQAQLTGQPVEVQEEIVRINTEARNLALQVGLTDTVTGCPDWIFHLLRHAQIARPRAVQRWLREW